MDLNDSDFSIEIGEDGNVPFTKGGVKPAVAVKNNKTGAYLTPDRDFKTSFRNNSKVTTDEKPAILTVTGKGNYRGTIKGEYAIIPRDLEDLRIVVPDMPFVKGKAKKPSVTVYDLNGKKLSQGKDYLVDWAGEDGPAPTEEPGEERTVTVYANDGASVCNYSGSKSAAFRYVDAKNFLNSLKPAVIESKEYTGSAITLTAQELDSLFAASNGSGSGKLVYGTDFEITEPGYSDNIKKGKAKVSFRGIGNFGGTKTVTFRIVQKKGSYRGRLAGGKMK